MTQPPEATGGEPALRGGLGGAVLRYTVLRLTAFLGVLGVLLVLGAPLEIAVLVGLVVSTLGSLVLLRGPRDEVTRHLAARADAKRAAADERRRRLAEG